MPNTPLRGGKNTVLEGGVRVRTALGGGYVPPVLRGEASTMVAHLVDWYPTLVELAGGAPYADPKELGAAVPVDGISMVAGLARRLRGEDAPFTPTAKGGALLSSRVLWHAHHGQGPPPWQCPS